MELLITSVRIEWRSAGALSLVAGKTSKHSGGEPGVPARLDPSTALRAGLRGARPSTV